jgi:hypothetical protein
LIPAVAGIPAAAGFPAVAGVLAVANLTADNVIPILLESLHIGTYNETY